MMTRRAWSLGSDLAGVATAMITTRAVPAPYPLITVPPSASPPKTLPTPWA